ncbi:GFA family protein [Marinihelvus fidelis]|uniref:GFA family protein n=1 Tax=Marinihelvus fidelis TaxID=2613842 RepID=A0A5N0TEU4_9GAMM|nr:GFA family protein [Marinihelvus fidelis]
MKFEGGCHCGAVHFEVAAPSKWCAHCHCESCRRYHGAGYVTWAGFDVRGFRVTRGEDALRWYESSRDAERGFCGLCGSSMLFRSERSPGEMHIALGSLDGAIDRAPQAHVFFDTHVDWVAIDRELPIHRPND